MGGLKRKQMSSGVQRKWVLGAIVQLVSLVILASAAQRKPNFIVILTDDQDTQMGGDDRRWMPKMYSNVADKGLTLRNFVVSMAWCCPSRVSLLTGRHVHNTNITSSSAPYGGAYKFQGSGLDANYLPVWLSSLGYNTYFTGKWLNSYTQAMNQAHCPLGWTVFEGMLDGSFQCYDTWYTTSYYSNNCKKGSYQNFTNVYQTSIMRDKGLSYIEDAVSKGVPFFIELAPIAPHDQGSNKAAVPAPGDERAFGDISYTRPPNYGVRLPREMGLSADRTSYEFSNSKWQSRIRSLKAVDDMVGDLVAKLDALGQLDNTYIVYTSDNGFQLGQHGLNYEKFTPFEEDVRVPFHIRGPKVPQGLLSDYQATMVDLPATIVTLAGGGLTPSMDGVPLPLDAIASGAAGPTALVGSTFSVSPPPPRPSPKQVKYAMSTSSASGPASGSTPAASPPPSPSPPATPVPVPATSSSDTSGGLNSSYPGEYGDYVESSGTPVLPPAPLTPDSPAAPAVPLISPSSPSTSPELQLSSTQARRMVQQATQWLAKGAASLTQAVMQVVQAKIEKDTRGRDVSSFVSDGSNGRAADGGMADGAEAQWASVGDSTASQDVTAATATVTGEHLEEGTDVASLQSTDASSRRLHQKQSGQQPQSKPPPPPPPPPFKTPPPSPPSPKSPPPPPPSPPPKPSPPKPPPPKPSPPSPPPSPAPKGSTSGTAGSALLRDTMLIEGWLDINMDQFYEKNYRAVRVCTSYTPFGTGNTFLGGMTCLKYLVWCIPSNHLTGQDLVLRQLFDLGTDPYELNNLYDRASATNSRLLNRLDALLTVASYCKGQSCRDPWGALHPGGTVHSLVDAMLPQYDNFYAKFVKFSFRQCARFFTPSNEVTDPNLVDLALSYTSTSSG